MEVGDGENIRDVERLGDVALPMRSAFLRM
jgi:hypothetical protein